MISWRTWYESLERASTPVHLMECVLVLEHYLVKAWLDQPPARLLGSAAPHMALRSVTLASVATRLFLLDKSINYGKVEARRSRRGGAAAAYDDGGGNTTSGPRRAGAAAGGAQLLMDMEERKTIG